MIGLKSKYIFQQASETPLAPAISVKSAMLKEELLAGIIDGQEVEVSFEEFPYYLRFYSSSPLCHVI